MSQPADILIQNAQVFTANPAQPRAEAVAIRGQEIIFVGDNRAGDALGGPHTRRINGGGATLLPGFIDSHFHLRHGALKLGDIQLDAAASLPDLTAAIQQFAAQHPHEPWLVGQGVRYSALPHQTLTRQQLDAISPNRPLIILSYDVHTAWANTAALSQANLLTDTPPLGPNCAILRAADGTAHGELVEPGAYNFVLNLIPEPSLIRQKTLLQEALAYLASLGVTGVHNMDGSAEQMELYQSLEAAGQLSLRVYLPFDVKPETPASALAEAVAMRQKSTPLVRGGAVKFFMDGVLETFTGFLLADYAGRPGDRGGALFEADHFNHMATAADHLGLQIFVHACGDAAVRRTLDGFEAAQQANGRRDSRHRVEHIELIHPTDVPRFASLGALASMQLHHAILNIEDPDPWPQRIDQGRWACSFAWETLRQAGATLAYGSDWPVASPNPVQGLYAALNRQVWAPGLPNQRQSLANALLGYTSQAAYAEFQEQQQGQLRPGYLADLVLLSENIFNVPPAEIIRVHPQLTIANGRIVFEA